MLPELVQAYVEENIRNMDETGCFLKLYLRRVLE